MSKGKKSRSSRAGIEFPIHRVQKLLRVRFSPKRRLQKGVAVSVTAYANFVMQVLIENASARVLKGNYIKSMEMHKSMAELPIFPNHATGLY